MFARLYGEQQVYMCTVNDKKDVKIVEKWDGKSDLTIGSEINADSSLYVQLYINDYFLVHGNSILHKKFTANLTDDNGTTNHQCVPLILLYSIIVPEKYQRTGIATSIIQQIDQICQKQSSKQKSIIYFAIGPLVGDNDALIRICKKIGGFQSCMPFSLLKKYCS